LLRYRSAALGLMLALTSAVHAASAQTAPPPSDSASKPAEAVPNFFRDIQANAFASLGYISNLNMPQDQTIGLRYFDNRANTFSVDLAELVVQKAVAKAGDAGFRIDLTAGTFAGLTQSAGLSLGDNADLQQAFASYIAPLGTGLRFDFGKFVTHMGYELIEGYDGYNDNYSRSLLFNYAIPLTHTGVKASYSPSSKVSLMAMVVNGWDDAIDNNASKSVGAQIMVKPADPVALYVNYIGGPEISDNNSSIRHVIDFVGTVTVNPMLSLGVNADFGTEDGTSLVKAGDDATWNGYAGYAKISTTSPFSLGLRAETFKDNGGTRLGIGEARVNEFTITPAFKFGSNFVVRAEGRYDSSDSSPFLDDKGIAKKNQATIGLNAIWVY
jgi:Putative beta-barrel porin-2, OmpL-like. bbp2